MRGGGLLIIDILIIGERLYVQDYKSPTANCISNTNATSQ
jgi:hypothetical protein